MFKTIADGSSISVSFSTYGNQHLFSDTFGRSSILTKEDLKDLATLMENATFLDDSALSHPRSDDFQHFYYFKTSLRGVEFRINVAKMVKIRSNAGGRNKVSQRPSIPKESMVACYRTASVSRPSLLLTVGQNHPHQDGP